MKKNGLKVAVWYVALIAVVIVVISLLYGGGSKTELTYGDIPSGYEGSDRRTVRCRYHYGV